MLTKKENFFMKLAVKLAKQGMYTTSPNPNVGCVIVKNDKVIGEGYHKKAGQAHAEIYALAMAGSDAKEADLYVTLEPCCHHGKTPPCVDKIIKSQVKRVIIGMQDPYYEVCGKGIEKLLEAGIEIVLSDFNEDIYNLNLGFISRITQNKPWITLKIDTDFDNKTIFLRKINEDLKQDIHFLKIKNDVIITDGKTYITNDTRINMCDLSIHKQPLTLQVNGEQKINFNKLLYKLSEQKINYVLVEGSMSLNAQFLENNLVDEIIFYLAPNFLEDICLSTIDLPLLYNFNNKFSYYLYKAQKLGSDIKIIFRKQYQIFGLEN